MLFREGMAARNDGQSHQAAKSLASSFEYSQDIDIKIQAHRILLQIFDELGPSDLFKNHRYQSLKAANRLLDQATRERHSGQLQQAAYTFKLILKLTSDDRLHREVHAILAEIYTISGQTNLSEHHRIQAQS